MPFQPTPSPAAAIEDCTGADTGMPIYRLRPGESATIAAVGVTPGAGELARSLSRVGFREGRRVHLLACGAFGGEPWAVGVAGRVFALRRHEAAELWVVR